MEIVNNHDAYMMRCVRDTPNTAVPWLLMASWLYYFDPDCAPIISDGVYDKLCQKVAVAYTRLTHVHKHLIDPEALASGSLYYLEREQYPSIVVGAARRLSEQVRVR